MSDFDVDAALPAYFDAVGSSGTVGHPKRVIEAVLTVVAPQIAARALREAADEVRKEARWQLEQSRRAVGREVSNGHNYTLARMEVVESVLRARADRQDSAE